MGNFSIEDHTANSTHLLTPNGDGWDVTPVFEREWNPTHSVPAFIPEPVRVVKENGVEEMRHNSSVMKTGKIYQVKWNGRMYGLRKTESEVEILRFWPDDEQGDQGQVRRDLGIMQERDVHTSCLETV